LNLRSPWAAPLFAQVVGLVIATLVATQVSAVIIILSLPPPALEIYTVADVAQAIRLDSATTHEGNRLVARTSDVAPATDTQGFRRRAFRNELARTLSVDVNDIVIAQPITRILVLHSSTARRLAIEDQPILYGPFKLGVRQRGGRWLVVKPGGGIGVDAWQQRMLLVFAVTAAGLAPLAWWFARRLAAPIAALAAGAERLGRDPRAPPLEPRGSAEVIAAVNAFNEMQERLRRHVEYRTTLVGAIAHDLRTPLTRLRFRIEAVPEGLREKLASDIDEMEAMVSATMEFARESARPRTRSKLEIASLVETVMDEAEETGADAAALNAERLVVDGDPMGLKRVRENLVNNALKFGGRARARAMTRDGMAVIEVDDDGPGIPPEEMERAFEPFHRLEASRSRDTGGLGLGLSVARAIARAHGGDVCLANRPEGGLRATLTLPLSVS
jgi:two-component system OmpR family sensor kinase